MDASSNSGRGTVAARIVAGLLGGLSLLSIVFFAWVTSESTPQAKDLIFIPLVLGHVSTFVGCVAIAMGKPWGQRALLAAGGISVITIGLIIVLEESLPVALLFTAPCWIGALLVFSPWPNFGVLPASPLPKIAIDRRIAVLALGLGGLTALLLLARDEIGELQQQMQNDKWEADCKKSGDAEGCGRWAMKLFFHPEQFDDMRQAVELSDKVCAEQLVHRACAFSAEFRHLHQWMTWSGVDHPYAAWRNEIALRACLDGDMRGCLVFGSLWWGDGPPAPDVERVTTLSREACQSGDAIGCKAWASASDDPDADRAACDAGFQGHCPEQPIPGCLDGEFTACQDSDDPAAQAIGRDRTLVGVDAQLALRSNPALYMVSLRGEEMSTHCEQGSGIACFAMGLNATADVNPFDEAPVPLNSLEVSMGRGCELGANISCYVFALRLLDRVKPEPTEIQRANELLDRACQNGHGASCQLRLTTQPLPADLTRLRTETRRICERSPGATSACTTWSELLAHEIGAQPWLMLPYDAYAHARDGCLDAAAVRSCGVGAWIMLDAISRRHDTVPPLYVQGTRLAEIGCRGGSTHACRDLFRFVENTQHYGMTPLDELRPKICGQVPDAC